MFCGSAVPPLWSAITWSRGTSKAAISGALLCLLAWFGLPQRSTQECEKLLHRGAAGVIGCACGIASWLAVAQIQNGAINIATTGGPRISLLYGHLRALTPRPAGDLQATAAAAQA